MELYKSRRVLQVSLFSKDKDKEPERLMTCAQFPIQIVTKLGFSLQIYQLSPIFFFFFVPGSKSEPCTSQRGAITLSYIPNLLPITILNIFLKIHIVFWWKSICLAPNTSSLSLPGKLLGDMADPHSGLHGGEAGSLLVFGTCGQVLLEHGQLQCCHGVLGRPQVSQGDIVVWTAGSHQPNDTDLIPWAATFIQAR